MFQCKACIAKDKHITDLGHRLERQTELLEKVVAPTYAPAITRQANIALDGAGHEQEPEQIITPKDMSEVELQQIAMLTGNY